MGIRNKFVVFDVSIHPNDIFMCYGAQEENLKYTLDACNYEFCDDFF